MSDAEKRRDDAVRGRRGAAEREYADAVSAGRPITWNEARRRADMRIAAARREYDKATAAGQPITWGAAYHRGDAALAVSRSTASLTYCGCDRCVMRLHPISNQSQLDGEPKQQDPDAWIAEQFSNG